MSRGTKFATKELSRATWPDFVQLFKRPGEWGGCWCIYYQRPRPLEVWSGRLGLSRQQRIAKNRRDKLNLVKHGRSHGILVYSNGKPVAWCRYGAKDELPRIDAKRRYKRLSLDNAQTRLWRITFFCVDRRFRKQGIAALALQAAMRSIKRKGGGVVEAYPAARRGALAIRFGTVSMFEREGFKTLSPLGKSNVLMRKSI